MKPVAWLMKDLHGREIAIADEELQRQQPWVQELWKGAEPLHRHDRQAERTIEAVRKLERSDFESDMI